MSAGLNRQTTAQPSYSALQSDLGATFGADNLAALTTSLGSTATMLTVTGASFCAGSAGDQSGGITSDGPILIVVNGNFNFINQAGASALTPGTFSTIYTQNAGGGGRSISSAG